VIRLRQIALIAPDLDPVVAGLRATLNLEVCFSDPGVGEFGLRNAMMLIGDQFLEVLSPVEEHTAVGRLLDKRGGPGGYMVIHEVDDLDARVARLGELDVRVVWAGDFPGIRGRHLHPSDVGGAIVSIDEPDPPGSWRWGGPDWETTANSGTGAAVDAITGVTIAATDSSRLAARWAELGIDESVTFVERGDSGPSVDGIVALDLRAVDRDRVGEAHEICGVVLRLV
jgi:hypothetical protein